MLLLILLIIYQYQSKPVYCSDEAAGISMQRTPNLSKRIWQHLQGKVRVSCWRKMPVFNLCASVQFHFYVAEAFTSPAHPPARGSLASWETGFFFLLVLPHSCFREAMVANSSGGRFKTRNLDHEFSFKVDSVVFKALFKCFSQNARLFLFPICWKCEE